MCVLLTLRPSVSGYHSQAGEMMGNRDKKRIQELFYEYLDTGWVDHDRTKTIKAMRRCFEQIPEAVWDEMPRVMVFAPSADISGQVFPFAPRESGAMIYLSPALERKSQAYVDFTVAHEFAHVVRGHFLPDNNETKLTLDQLKSMSNRKDVPSEISTDELAESWGFKRV